jgi:hypothetical protein
VPRAFIDLKLPAASTGTTVSGADVVTLDDPMLFGSLTPTPLISPGTASTATQTLTKPDGTIPSSGDMIEDVKINVSVPDNQAKGLYHGFVSVAAAVVAEVYAHVR